MFNRLEKIIKEMEGNVLTLCIDNKLLDSFNNKVNVYTIYSNETVSFVKTKKVKTNRGKNINIKRLRKSINHKSCDYIIINMNQVYKYYKYIIKDSIYLNNNIIYIYFDKSIDPTFILDKYKRYNIDYKIDEYKSGYIIKIDNKKGKNNIFMDIIYFMEDTIYNVADIIGNLLIS